VYYVLLSAVYFCRLVGPKPLLYLLIQPLVFFLILFTGSSSAVWICAVGFLCIGSHWTMFYLKAALLVTEVLKKLAGFDPTTQMHPSGGNSTRPRREGD
jgi:hypothetical protein